MSNPVSVQITGDINKLLDQLAMGTTYLVKEMGGQLGCTPIHKALDSSAGVLKENDQTCKLVYQGQNYLIYSHKTRKKAYGSSTVTLQISYGYGYKYTDDTQKNWMYLPTTLHARLVDGASATAGSKISLSLGSVAEQPKEGDDGNQIGCIQVTLDIEERCNANSNISDSCVLNLWGNGEVTAVSMGNYFQWG